LGSLANAHSKTRPRSAFEQARVPIGASHAIGHVLGGSCDVHYFCTPGMVPSALRYNQPAPPEAQKSIAGAQRAPDLDASDALQASSAYLGVRAGFRPLGEDKLSLPAEKAVFSIFA
jgi:maleylacetate reductase